MTTVTNQHTPKFKHKSCKAIELENVLGYLRYHNANWRFCDKVRRELGEVVFNLNRSIKVQYKVGHGRTIQAKLRDKLVEAGLMEWSPGYYVKDRASKPSTITPTPLFQAAVNRYCQLKVGQDKHVGFWQDRDTLNELIDFNAFASEHEITITHGVIDPIQRFNYLPLPKGKGVIRQRLINSIHNIKKTVRPTVKIDGEDTVQFDVTATHPQLIFNFYLKQPMPIDPYDIAETHKDQKLIRDAAKIAVMMMLNNGGRKSAAAAFRKALRKLDNEPIKIAVDCFVESQISILDLVFERNPALQDFFYKSMYRELQHMEANIAWAFMRRLASEGIPCLTVHDEGIVKTPDLNIAIGIYKQCWIEEVGTQGLGIEPMLKIKKEAE